MKKVALLLFVALSSCQKDEPATPTSSDPRAAFVATWICQESSSQNGNSTFEVHITKSSTSPTQIIIENLYNYGSAFMPYAEVNAAGTAFSIPSQVIQGNNIVGNGTLSGTITINMNYTIDNGSIADVVTAVLTKK